MSNWHPSFGSGGDERPPQFGKQFVALGVPLEHPFKHIRNVIASGMTEKMLADLDRGSRGSGGPGVDESDRIEIRSIMDEVARGAVERALHPDPSISLPARSAIERQLRKHYWGQRGNG